MIILESFKEVTQTICANTRPPVTGPPLRYDLVSRAAFPTKLTIHLRIHTAAIICSFLPSWWKAKRETHVEDDWCVSAGVLYMRRCTAHSVLHSLPFALSQRCCCSTSLIPASWTRRRRLLWIWPASLADSRYRAICVVFLIWHGRPFWSLD